MTEWNASEYQHRSSMQEQMAGEVLARIAFRGDERVLDVGSGAGKVTAAIAARVPQGCVVGIDASPAMVAFACRHFPPEHYPNLRYQLGDARTLPFRQEFDLAFSFNVLHWVHDQDAALASLRAALKPQGRAYLRFVPECHRPTMEDVLEEVIREPRWSPYFQGHTRPYIHFTPDQYRTLAQRNGFQVLQLFVRTGDWQFPSREAFAGWVQVTFGAWVQKVPAELHEAFLNDVLNAYRAAAANGPSEENVFKIQQLDVELLC